MNNQSPKVSVVSITYGHQEFILETIKGVLMQQYKGEIEFIIANDNSPDDTHSIVTNFLTTNPIPTGFQVKYTKHENNLGMMPNFMWALQQATGNYIALCEGDDYWTDTLKLQKQVDFLEENEDVSLCFHNCNVLFDDKDNIASNNNRGLEVITENRVYESLEILKKWLIPTASVIFRSKDLSTRFFNDIAINRKFIYGDRTSLALTMTQGSGGGLSSGGKKESLAKSLSTHGLSVLPPGVNLEDLQSELTHQRQHLEKGVDGLNNN